MTTKSVAFRARARTIDHLGKGQIADCPTAVSELWKNAYDAYARDVALHTYDGEYKCGAIIDNGCGMHLNQITESWLVVGTESKSKKNILPEIDRFRLPSRKTQGEKGIGRLSCAFLAPVTFLITKKIHEPYAVALIDWRLFENPYLSISDITIPVAEFSDFDRIEEVFSDLLLTLQDNFCSSARTDLSIERQKEIRDAWDKFGYDQIDIAEKAHEEIPTTEERMTRFCTQFKLDTGILTQWESLLDKVAELDGDRHGTALFLLDLNRDLALLTNPGDTAKENAELTAVKSDLVDTLRAFFDPYETHNEMFSYQIITHSTKGGTVDVLRQNDVFSDADFSGLEHTVVGKFDSKGWFTGKVKAWGEEKGIIKIPPTIELDASGSKVGPFSIKIGTFEHEFDKSSLDVKQWETYEVQKKYAGLMIFRDGLRVLPYGRIDNDFFEIEDRRSRNAGRYYWSTRRTFGKISIFQDDNFLLKDKAGREGFIRNQAARELKELVKTVLISLADRFFGTKSDERQEMLAIVKQERELRKEAQTQARRQSQRSFNEELKAKAPELEKQLSEAKELRHTLTEKEGKLDHSVLTSFDEQLQQLEAARTKLKTPVKPPKLGDNEEKYRTYRDMYGEYSAHLVELKEARNRFESEISKASPVQTARKNFERNQGLLNAHVNRSLSIIEGKVQTLLGVWSNKGRDDRGEYYKKALPLVEGVGDGANLEVTLNSLDAVYTTLVDTFAIEYETIQRALDRLAEGINLDAAFSMAEEEKAYFEEKAKSLQALAQLGISVEILAHELEELDGMVTSGLNSLPSDIKSNHPGFKTAYNSHKALTQQIRFLSPLKLSGYQSRQEITGKMIQEHIEKFFRDRFERQRVNIQFQEKFTRMRIKDLPSRIYPVFVNIINNALYWVSLAQERRIVIDVVDDEVVIANSGPPVDDDDIPRLFELFYSRRSNGNGVGLYLCKENLAVAHHKIRYVPPSDAQLVQGGANFAITFNKMEMA